MVFFIAFVTTISSYAQGTSADSLYNKIQSLKGEAKVDALVEYSRSLASINYEKSKEAAQEAFALATQLQYRRGEITSLIAEGVNEFSVFHNEEARKLFKRSIKISQKIKARDLEGYAFAYLGLNYQNANQLDTAIDYYNRSLELLKDNRNPLYLSFLYLSLSDYYGLRGEPQAQFEYLEKCWIIRKESNLTMYLPYIGTRMAAYYVNKGEFAKARTYLDESQSALGNDTLNNEKIALIDQQRAIVCAREGNTIKALELSNRARKFYEENSFPLELTHLLIETAEVFEEISNYEAGLKEYFLAKKIAEEHSLEYEIFKVTIGIAWIYYDLEDLNTATSYLQKVMESPSLHQYPKEEASAINLTGLIHLKKKKVSDAMSSLRQSLSIRKKIHDQIGTAAELYNIGLVFEELNQFDSALYYHHKSEAIEESSGHAVGMAFSYERLGALYTKLKQFEKAEAYLIKAEQLSRKIKAGANLIAVLKDRQEFYKAQGKLEKALTYATYYENLKDSIFNNTLSNRIASMEIMNEVEKKNNDIILLNKTRQLQENELLIQKSKLQQQGYITLSAILALTLLGSVTFLIYRNSKRKQKLNREIQAQATELIARNKLLRRQQEAINTMNKELIKSNEEISAKRIQVEEQNLKLKEASEIIEKQNREIKSRNENLEEEVKIRTKELMDYNQQLEQFAFVSSHNLRAPVARILGLGQLLELPGKSEADEKLIKEKLIKTAKEMDRVVKDLSSILEIRDHRTEQITDIDLAEELELVKINLQSELASSAAVIQADFSHAPSAKTVRTYLHNILFNLISNAIKYRNPANTTVILIKSEKRDNYTRITVQDNGLGINVSKYRDKLFTINGRFHTHVEGSGIALYLVKKQLDSIGGKIEVASEVNVGTIFYVYLKDTDESISA